MAGIVVNWGQRYNFLVRLPKEKPKNYDFIYNTYKKAVKKLVDLSKNTNFAGKNV
jgi:hypothetical protein